MLKNLTQKRAEARRHRLLLKAAHHVIGRRVLVTDTDFSSSPAEIVALAFGWYGMRIDADEALDYLNAVLADRGFPLHGTDGTR